MNTPVNFELAKLLKEKGFDEQNLTIYQDGEVLLLRSTISNSQFMTSRNYTAPTIAEVVMWLYEKHGIWISVDMVFEEQQTGFWYCIRQKKPDDFAVQSDEYVTTSEAYEAAIQYCLINLI